MPLHFYRGETNLSIPDAASCWLVMCEAFQELHRYQVI